MEENRVIEIKVDATATTTMQCIQGLITREFPLTKVMLHHIITELTTIETTTWQHLISNLSTQTRNIPNKTLRSSLDEAF